MKHCLLILAPLAAFPAWAGYVDEVKADLPVAYWRLAESTPAPVEVQAVNRGNQGTLLNGIYRGGVALGQPGALAGDANTSALFSPAAGQYVEIPYSPIFNPAFTLSVELWAKVTGGSGFRSPLASLTTSGQGNFGYVFYVTDQGRWQFRTARGTFSESYNVVTGPAAQTDVWTHLVGIYNGDFPSPRTQFYVNGQQVGEVEGLAEMNLTVPLHIGAGAIGQGTPANHFQGGIDEVAIYERILSPAEIATHYQKGATGSGGGSYALQILQSGAEGYWRMEEASPATPTVATNIGSLGSAANGLFLNGAVGGRPGALLSDPSNRAAGFDGADDKVEVPFLPRLNPERFSVECWALVRGGSGLQGGAVTAREVDATTGTRGYSLRKSSGDRWELWTGTGGPNAMVLIGPPAFENQWSHLVGTYDGQFSRLYVDGTLVDLRRTSMATNSTRPLRIGAGATEQPLGDAFLKGDVDEVAVFTNVLSDARVLAHFLAGGRPRPLPVAPTIVEEPLSRTNYAGQSVSFSVGAAGTLPLAHQWEFNGFSIPGATNPVFTIAAIGFGHAGRYAARISNPAGFSVSQDAHLTVDPEGPPLITAQPRSLTNFVGGTARFSVEATGGTNLLYQWQFNGGNLAGRTNRTLVLTNLVAASQGSYRAWVSSSVASAVSDPAGLLVVTPPAGSYTATVMADQPLALWRFGERSENTAHDYAGGFHADLVGNVELGRPGALAGEADTAYGFVASSRAAVEVPLTLPMPAAPFSLEAWARLSGAENTDRTVIGNVGLSPSRGARLQVSADGRWEFWCGGPEGVGVITGPYAETGKWSHVVGTWDGAVSRLFVNGAEVGSRGGGFTPGPAFPLRIGANSSDLGLIADFFEGDLDEVAVYDRVLTPERVIAHYGVGVGTALRPQFVELPESVAVFPGFDARFRVLALGSPPLTYQWQFNETNLSGRTNATLALTNVTAAQAGRYRVIVANSAGSITSPAATLSVVILPGQSYVEAVRADAPISYWRLGESSGGNALDAAGPRHGTYRQGVVQGQPGAVSNDGDKSAGFVRAGETHVEVPYAAVLNPDQFTIEAWARVTGAGGSLRSPVSSWIDSPQRGFALVAGASDTWQFWTGRGGLSGWDLVEGPAVESNRWTHLVATFDGTTRRLYVDGVPAGTSVAPFAPNDLGAFRIGGHRLGNPDAGFYFEGGVDEVALYPRPLSPERILVHYGIATGIGGLPTLSLARSGANVVIQWANGTLQQAATVQGPYESLAGTSPLTVPPTASARYYRVRQ